MNIVHLCDCMDFMRDKPDKAYDLAIVDVNYGINQGGEKNYTRCKLAIAKDYKGFDDSKAPEKLYFDTLIRISKNQIIFGANHFISKIPYDSSCWIVWDKENGENDFADCELAWTSFDTSVRRLRYRWAGMLQEKMGKGKEERIHPCQKPVALYKWLLKNYAKPGQTIFDSHVGSGSSRIACYDMGFDF
jgi:site-specific DNA-methyltransferase (adenine-specific)